MSFALSSDRLLDLAKSRTSADRERLLLGVIELCSAPGAASSMADPKVQVLLDHGRVLLGGRACPRRPRPGYRVVPHIPVAPRRDDMERAAEDLHREE